MEEYIPPADAAAPGSRSNNIQEQTTPIQPRSGAAYGEMQDPRRETFSNAEAVANPKSVTSVKPTNNSAILDMTNPAYSVPGADFLLATEYIVGGMVYDAGEVLDGSSFPDLQAERNVRIAEILNDLHRQKTMPQQFVPRTIPANRPSAGMTRDSFIRQENLRLWKEELFDASFVNTGDPNRPVRVNVKKLTMQDGRVLKK